MRPDNAVSVQVSCFASEELDAANDGNLGSRAWGVDVTCSLSVQGVCEASGGLICKHVHAQPTRSFHELAPVLGH